MDRLTMCGAAAVMAVLVNPAAAQVTKTITGETKSQPAAPSRPRMPPPHR